MSFDMSRHYSFPLTQPQPERTPVDFAAQKAGFYDDLWRKADTWKRKGGLADFAEAVRQMEREACARCCEQLQHKSPFPEDVIEDCVAAIRARDSGAIFK